MIFFLKKWKYLNTVLDSDTGQGIEFGNMVFDVAKSGRRRRLCRASFSVVVITHKPIVIIPIAIAVDVFSPIFPFHRKLSILPRFNIQNPFCRLMNWDCWMNEWIWGSLMDDGEIGFCVFSAFSSSFSEKEGWFSLFFFSV